MHIGRTILALVIALSVATLPVAAGARLSIKSTDALAMSSAEQMDDMDCCPHQANPCDKALDGCGTMAACALKCFSFAGISFSDVEFPSVFRKIRLSTATKPLPSQSASPPFRPPRA